MRSGLQAGRKATMERGERPQIPPSTAVGLGGELQWLVGVRRGLGMESNGAGAIPHRALGLLLVLGQASELQALGKGKFVSWSWPPNTGQQPRLFDLRWSPAGVAAPWGSDTASHSRGAGTAGPSPSLPSARSNVPKKHGAALALSISQPQQWAERQLGVVWVGLAGRAVKTNLRGERQKPSQDITTVMPDPQPPRLGGR